MDRRDFLKISTLTGVAATLDACGKPENKLIRFIPEEDLVPGVATWKPSLCTLCGAGCGTLVRVMEGDAEVRRNGQAGLIKMGLAKKLEGNPNHPVNRGKLCAIGQVGLQITYHPERVRNPLKRSGARGSGQFEEIGWDEALKEVHAQLSMLRSSGATASLRFLTRPLRGQRRELAQDFLRAFGAPAILEYEFFDDAVLRQANLLSFGRAALPTVDLSRANYVISFGADFLGTWNSPVSQAIGYGEMRQGRAGRRGKFVQVEARMSQTGANADEWIACRPGTEGLLALGIAHVILQEKLRTPGTGARAGSAIDGWTQGLPDHSPENVERSTGVPAATIRRLAREMAKSRPAGAIIGGTPLAQSNGMFSALAVNALEELVDAYEVSEKVVSFSPDSPLASSETLAGGESSSGFAGVKILAQEVLQSQPNAPKVLLLCDANPVFHTPPALRVREALSKVPFIVSFGSFIDETSSLADLILPDHSPLESWLDDEGSSGTTQAVASLAAPAVRPLHNTRAMPDVLLELASGLGGPVAAALPWKTYDAALQAAFTPLRTRSGSVVAKSDDEFWQKVQDQGSWWSAGGPVKEGLASGSRTPLRASASPRSSAAKFSEPQFDGAASDWPFYFMPYASQSLHDGTLAHLPWLQEMPDVMTSAMWSSWVEINPKTAERMGIQTGDIVEVSSRQGNLHAPAVVSPGIAPDVVAMPIGQGHEYFSRYADGRGANPLSILAPVAESETGALAWAATRVKVARAGGPQEAKLILFGGGTSRFPVDGERR